MKWVFGTVPIPALAASIDCWLLTQPEAKIVRAIATTESERLHQHFPRRGNYLGQFLTLGESLARTSPRSLVVGLEFTQPCLNAGKQVRFVAMRAPEWGDVTRQGGEALHIQINAGVDLVSGCGANKSQRRHYKPFMPWSSHSEWQKRSPDRGKPGLLLVPLGRTCVGKTPLTRGVLAASRDQFKSYFLMHKRIIILPSGHVGSRLKDDQSPIWERPRRVRLLQTRPRKGPPAPQRPVPRRPSLRARRGTRYRVP
jgi:hypothetical protein